MTASTIAMPIGLLIAGPVGEVVGISRWFLGSGIALLATGVYSRLATKQYDDQTQLLEKAADSTK